MSATPRPGPSANLPKPPRDAAERGAWLKAQLDDVFSAPALAKAKISAIVVDADTGKTIYARGEKTQLNAASNVKIVTAAAALSLLGPEYRWRTTLAIVGPPSGPPLPAGGEVAGDLYLRGAGDPTFATEDLSAMVSDLAALGLHKVRGALVVDDSLFEGGYIPPAYDQTQRFDRVARARVGRVAERQRRRGDHHPRRRRRRARARGRRSAVAVLRHRRPRRHVGERSARARRRHQGRRRRTRASTSPGAFAWAPIRARSTAASRSRRCSWARR